MDLSVLSIPYHPFILSRTGSELPSAVDAAVDRPHLYEVPDDFGTAESLLSLYVADLLFLVYPGFHKNAVGETFTNVSYYTDRQDAEAFSANVRGVCRTTVSIGQVRHLVALAAEVYRLVCPIVFDSAAPAGRSAGFSLADLICERHTIDDARFTALLGDYPRLVNKSQHSFESEFLLFADMLRFVWCHEWAHGLAGHLWVQEEIARAQPTGVCARQISRTGGARAAGLRVRGGLAGDRCNAPADLSQRRYSGRCRRLSGRHRSPHPVDAACGQHHDDLLVRGRAKRRAHRTTASGSSIPVPQCLGPGSPGHDHARRGPRHEAGLAECEAPGGHLQAGGHLRVLQAAPSLTPLVHETETMKRAREQVDMYRTVLDELDLDAWRISSSTRKAPKKPVAPVRKTSIKVGLAGFRR